jgi:hypothetical protein
LHGRQEIHEEGNAEGHVKEDILGGMLGARQDSYVITTKVKHYVKLHFTRPWNLVNGERIRSLEAEYRSSLPRIPSLIWPLVFTAFCVAGLIGGISDTQAPPGTSLFAVALGTLGGWWIYSRLKTRQRAIDMIQTRIQRRRELLSEAQGLLSGDHAGELPSAMNATAFDTDVRGRDRQKQEPVASQVHATASPSCPDCGKVAESRHRYCTGCGARLSRELEPR